MVKWTGRWKRFFNGIDISRKYLRFVFIQVLGPSIIYTSININAVIEEMRGMACLSFSAHTSFCRKRWIVLCRYLHMKCKYHQGRKVEETNSAEVQYTEYVGNKHINLKWYHAQIWWSVITALSWNQELPPPPHRHSRQNLFEFVVPLALKANLTY